MEMESSQKLVIAFAALIIGVMLLSTTASEVMKKTSNTAVVSESINIAPARIAGGHINASYYFRLSYGCPYKTAWRSDSACIIADKGVKNQTSGALTTVTDYAFVTNSQCTSTANVDGDIAFKDTNLVNQSTATTNTTTVSYTYCPDDYLTQSWNRNVMMLVPGFFAIALLLIAVGLFFSVAKDYDLI